MMHTWSQSRREAAQIQIDLEDLARAMDRLMPHSPHISSELRQLANHMARINYQISQAQPQ